MLYYHRYYKHGHAFEAEFMRQITCSDDCFNLIGSPSILAEPETCPKYPDPSSSRPSPSVRPLIVAHIEGSGYARLDTRVGVDSCHLAMPGICPRLGVNRISSPLYPWHVVETSTYSKPACNRENTVHVYVK